MGERTRYPPGTFSWAELVTAAWIPYFGHDDPERLAGEIGDLGGRLYNGPMQVPNGVFAVLGDPQGAVFAVLTGQYDD